MKPNYSTPSTRPKNKSWCFWASAKHHICSFSLKNYWAAGKDGEAPSKTHIFLRFHRVQAPKTTALLNPFLWGLPIFLARFSPQSTKHLSWHLGAVCCRTVGASKWCYKCLAKTQLVRICCPVSSWSQRTHCSGCASPHFANQSTVQHLWIARHRKTLHSGGAHDFQRCFQEWYGTIEEGPISRPGSEGSTSLMPPVVPIFIVGKNKVFQRVPNLPVLNQAL